MERSSGEALATISDSKILQHQQNHHHHHHGNPPQSSSSSSAVFFARSTIFVSAAMDVTSVVVFVMSLGIMEKGTSVAHEAILEIIIGTSLVTIITLLACRFQLQIEQLIIQPLMRRYSFLQNNRILGSLYILRQQDRAAITILMTIVASNFIIPGAELLLAAAAVGMKITYDGSVSETENKSQQQQHDNDDDDDDDETNKNNNSKTLTPIAVIDSYSVLIYSVMFSIIGLRLDASQLILTLVDHPKLSLALFCGRLFGLVVGGFAGSVLGGNATYMKYRGVSLITRIAVSIILLQKMEDAFSSSSSAAISKNSYASHPSAAMVKPLVHAAIGAVLMDMIVGPAALQWTLKKVVAEEQQQKHVQSDV